MSLLASRRPLRLAAAIAIALPGGPLAGQAAPTFARLEARSSVEILDLQRQVWRPIYKAREWATAVSVGPSNDRLALLNWTEEPASPGSDSPRRTSELVVIDTTGRVLSSKVKQVQRYAWCGSDCLVYITGVREESHIGFIPQGIGMLSLTTGQATKLPAPSTPIAITWAAFAGAAYVKNWPRPGEALIYKLNPRAATLEPTPFLDHLFSPTGRYYLHEREFTDSLIVYETRTNAPVNMDQFRREAIVLGWASPSEDVLLAIKRPPRRTGPDGPPLAKVKIKAAGSQEPQATYKLYDVARARVRTTVKGHLGSWAAPDNKFLVRSGTHYQVIGEH